MSVFIDRLKRLNWLGILILIPSFVAALVDAYNRWALDHSAQIIAASQPEIPSHVTIPASVMFIFTLIASTARTWRERGGIR